MQVLHHGFFDFVHTKSVDEIPSFPHFPIQYTIQYIMYTVLLLITYITSRSLNLLDNNYNTLV